jgi:serine/threonine protein kinase
LHLNLICHLDLKFENILINASNHVKLLDFGSSSRGIKVLDSRDYKGSPGFSPPEVEYSTRLECMKIDMWGLGVILLKLSSFTSIDDSNSKYSGLLEILNGLLNVDPIQRWDIHRVVDCEWYRNE